MVKAGIKDPHDVEAVRKLGVVDLPLLQRKLNFHASVTRDLFGSEISSNAAEVFGAGIKGRFNESNLKGDDHCCRTRPIPSPASSTASWSSRNAPALRALNSRLLDDFIVDCQGGIDRWNKSVEKAGIDFKFVQPHKGFNRRIGEFGGNRISPSGEVLTEDEWNAKSGDWLPNEDDMAFIVSLMKPCHEPGKYASWIAPPRVGVNSQPGDFEYVKIA